ncbi:hypothetical protein F5877DRAFT_81005 [Lentinula edodes]|nr:hypothetical protein F5877DRAFT_81005 [Lentinula edodes]
MVGNLLFRAVSFSHLDQFITAKNAWNLAQRNTMRNIVFLHIGSSHELDSCQDYIHSRHRRRWIGSWQRASPIFPTLSRVTELKLAGAVLPTGFASGISELTQLRHLTIERCCCEGPGGFSKRRLGLDMLMPRTSVVVNYLSHNNMPSMGVVGQNLTDNSRRTQTVFVAHILVQRSINQLSYHRHRLHSTPTTHEYQNTQHLKGHGLYATELR